MRRLAHAAASLALVALAGAGLSGCFVGRALGKSITSLAHSPLPVANKVKQPRRADARLAVLWVGHATVLVQMDDKLVLTDPVFSDSVGQLSKRLVEPGLAVEDLPPVDAVVISHMHFDHLSLGTLEQIEPKVRALLLPRGGLNYLTDFGFPAYELGRFQPWEKDGLRVTAVPVEHVGFRYGIDAEWMTESFAGYVFEYHGLKVYFGGDTAYAPTQFAETQERFPELDLAILPIGPIEPHSLMRRYHLDPDEAMHAFLDLGAKRMLPVHYDTFVNSLDEHGEALRRLDAAKQRWALGEREVLPIAIGEQRVLVKKESPATPSGATGD